MEKWDQEASFSKLLVKAADHLSERSMLPLCNIVIDDYQICYKQAIVQIIKLAKSDINKRTQCLYILTHIAIKVSEKIGPNNLYLLL